MLKQGRTVLEVELGETYTVGGIKVEGGLRSDESYIDPLKGSVRETLLSFSRSAFFGTTPHVGAIVTNGIDSWRVGEVRAGSRDRILIVCIGNQ